MITAATKNKIKQIVRFFETSKIAGAKPDALVILPDGPKGIRQITYGESQTTEFGNLPVLLKMYANAKGQFSADTAKWLPRVGKMPSLETNQNFLNHLKAAGKDPVMASVQAEFFDKYYWTPAEKWFKDNGFTLPLSLLVIYDSMVHSGSILESIRNRFKERVPSQKGNEQKWITEYVNHRDNWLEKHPSQLLRNTDYRTDSFIFAIKQGNWQLDFPFTIVNYPDAKELSNPKIIANIP